MKAPQSHIFNPYIAKILAGQDPTAMDFVQGPSNSPFTPGINPMGSNPQQAPGLGEKAGGMFGKIDSFLGKPGGMMLMNLLAQQGYSKMPQSRIGAVGRAALMTSQQQAAQQDAEAKRKLMEAQGKYYTARAENPNIGNQAKPPASIAEWNLYAEQERAAGREPMDFKPWVQQLARLRAVGTAEGKESVSTPAQTATDTAYAQTYIDWTQNGQGDALKGLNQLRSARETLRTENVSGKDIAMIPEKALPFINPVASNTKSLVEEVVQRNLRLILGAQFAEKEGERLIARAYDPALSEEINGERLDRLIAQMELAMRAKQDQANYYNLNGTLKGWQGKQYTMDDFESLFEDDANNDFDAKWDAAKSGTVLQAPDGTYRRKP